MPFTTDPTDPRLGHRTDANPGPQNPVYLVLPEEERARGFVRPLRTAYRHVGERPSYPLRDPTPEEQERGYARFEDYPPERHPILGRGWTQAQLDDHGCGTVTSMARPLCETYARDPSFYGATYCVTCRRHLPVREFVWVEADGTDGPVVGS
jgi:hypothetical protein